MLLQTTVRRLAKEKVIPGAAGRDESEEFDWSMVELIRENGLFGTDFPEIYGGSDAGMLALCMAIEELSKADAACGVLLVDQELGALPILLAANESQKQRYLPQLAEGKQLAAFALTEPAAGSDVAQLRCRAKKDGDSYVLNGTKSFITNGGVADIITVYAVIDPEKPTHKNAGVFIVEKGTPVFRLAAKNRKWVSAGRTRLN